MLSFIRTYSVTFCCVALLTIVSCKSDSSDTNKDSPPTTPTTESGQSEGKDLSVDGKEYVENTESAPFEPTIVSKSIATTFLFPGQNFGGEFGSLTVTSKDESIATVESTDDQCTFVLQSMDEIDADLSFVKTILLSVTRADEGQCTGILTLTRESDSATKTVDLAVKVRISDYGSDSSASCSGSATSCNSIHSSTSCSMQAGCNWSPYSNKCLGIEDSCRSLSSSYSCKSQEGCHWSSW